MSEDRLEKKLTSTVELILLTIVIQKPGILLRELKAELHTDYRVDISLSTICNFLHKSGFNHQKMVLVAKQRDNYLRSVFIHDTALYKTEMFVFLDETRADKRNAIRRYGYSVRGKPAISHVFFDCGEHISAIYSCHVV